jgi:hypothetical protein
MSEHDQADPSGESSERWPGTPRWVKVSLIIAGLVAVLVVILLLVGGDHGPARHMP